MKTINNLEGGLFPPLNLFEQDNYAQNGSRVDLLDPEDEGSSNGDESESTDGFDSERLLNGNEIKPDDVTTKTKSAHNVVLSPELSEHKQKKSRVIVDIPQKAKLHEEACLPIFGLPDEVQEIITAVAEVFQCPQDFVTSTVFTACSTAVGNQVKCFDGKYTNPSLLWMAIVANSGTNKTTPSKWILEPLQTYEDKLYDQRIRDKTPVKRLIINDSTPEKRAILLQDNPLGLLMYRNELLDMFEDFGRYSKSGEDVNGLISIYDQIPYHKDRVATDGNVKIPCPYLGIMGTIQPGLISSTFGVRKNLTSGFSQRFLYCFPTQGIPTLYNDNTISENLKEQWYSYVGSLLGIRNQPERTILLHPEAKQRYIEYYNYLQKKKFDANNIDCAAYSKMQIQVERLALTISIMRHKLDGWQISELSMLYAIDCMLTYEQYYTNVSNYFNRSFNSLSNNAIRILVERYPDLNQSKLAEALGISHQAVNKALKK
jgi:hypothetical protein